MARLVAGSYSPSRSFVGQPSMLVWHSHVCVVWISCLSVLGDDDVYLAPERWKLAMGLYIIGFVSYGATLVFYAAAFPRLARNTPHSRSLRERYEKGQITIEEYEREESLEKNRISNISTVGLGIGLRCESVLIFAHQVHSNIGYVVTDLLNLALLIPPKTANDPKVDNYVLVLCVHSLRQVGSSLNLR